jgi:hypothetical protein
LLVLFQSATFRYGKRRFTPFREGSALLSALGQLAWGRRSQMFIRILGIFLPIGAKHIDGSSVQLDLRSPMDGIGGDHVDLPPQLLFQCDFQSA